MSCFDISKARSTVEEINMCPDRKDLIGEAISSINKRIEYNIFYYNGFCYFSEHSLAKLATVSRVKDANGMDIRIGIETSIIGFFSNLSSLFDNIMSIYLIYFAGERCKNVSEFIKARRDCELYNIHSLIISSNEFAAIRGMDNKSKHYAVIKSSLSFDAPSISDQKIRKGFQFIDFHNEDAKSFMHRCDSQLMPMYADLFKVIMLRLRGN